VGDDWVDFYFQTSKMDSDTQNVNVRLVAIPETSNQPNVDMMDKCDRGFQLTTSGLHSIKERFLWKQLVCNDKIGPENPLKLYFVTIASPKNFKLDRTSYKYVNMESLFGNESDLKFLVKFYMEKDNISTEDFQAFIMKNDKEEDLVKRRKALGEKLDGLFQKLRPNTNIGNSFKFFVVHIEQDFFKKDTLIPEYVDKLVQLKRKHL